ncbi:MAG: 5-dehydro-2-deoxygluconokinase [Pseudomonadota bacterium]
MAEKTIDAVMIGRAGVDFYGDQVGARLEDMGSFSKYIGGSPTNTAIGAARLGMKTALISRVGDDAMGGFIREELSREGVSVDHLRTDHDRMTALVLLGIRDKESFPLIFYRESCADMAISVDDIDEALITSAKAVVTSGTHFSTESTNAASVKALELAKTHGAMRWIDLDYRPVLWGLGSKGDGETRFIADDAVTAHLQGIMPHLDAVVGTEEEIHIAGGSTDTITCLKTLRGLTDATFIVKLGPMGCAVFEGGIPETIDGGLVVGGFPVEVFNVLGAGDAFMGGLVTGVTEGQGWEAACRMANACGAFAVSRHACAPSYPSRKELETFIANGSDHFRLREDPALNQLHWSTTRQGDWPEVLAFAFDHRSQLEALCDDVGKIAGFKQLCAEVTLEAKANHPDRGIGTLCDRRLGLDALHQMTGNDLWMASPVEWPSSRPLEFEGGANISDFLKEVPQEHIVKCLCFMHPDDDAAMMDAQLTQIQRLFEATRTWNLELLLEIIPPKGSAIDDVTVARCIDRIYALGIFPDWWKLQAPSAEHWDASWAAWETLIQKHDPHCRGVVLLGLSAPIPELCDALRKCKSIDLCKGFAVGRSVFGVAAEGWFKGQIDDAKAKQMMAAAFEELITAWD